MPKICLQSSIFVAIKTELNMKKSLWLFLFVYLLTNSLTAQQSIQHTKDLAKYNQALELYNQNQYLSAQKKFAALSKTNVSKEIKANCAYYEVSCAVRLNQSSAEQQLQEYLDVYPESANKNQVCLDAAFHFFDNTGYGKALLWFEKVDDARVGAAVKSKYNFAKGYSYFVANKTDLAEEYLKQVEDSKDYGVQAKYYLGYMAYTKDEYKRANQYLSQIENDEAYATKVNYLLADINFNLKNFESAINYGLKEIENTKAKEKAELSKIIGESYFNLKKYEESIPYLEAYDQPYIKWNATDYYQMGYVYYKVGQYEKAISFFNKIILEQNGIAQNAYYHLGESYLKVEKKLEAFHAFKSASEMNFEPELQEDAYYNYAKLSYDIGNPYESVPTVLRNFLKKYPKTTNKKEINQLIVSSFVLSKDYKEALRILEEDPSISLPNAYQKAAYLLGKDLFADEKYQESIVYFEKALSKPVDAYLVLKSYFLKAEAEYLLGEYKEAIISYKQYIEIEGEKDVVELRQAHYSIAYAYFKLKEYELAIKNFNVYVGSEPIDKVRLNDAYLRLGDCYYVTKQYWTAANAYNMAIKMKQKTADYAHYQKAMCYGYIDKRAEKIKGLNEFAQLFPKSSYNDDAVFELANTYSLSNENKKALSAYQKLVEEYPKSVFRSKALLRQALIYYNADKDDDALVKLKKVVEEFPSTPESIEAVATAKIIYIDQGRVDEYAAWVKKLDFIEISNEELDNLTYESAEKQYLQNSTEAATKAFADYISKYPKGLHSLQANYYEAQLLYSEGKKEESIPYYQYVLSIVNNEYTVECLAKLSRVYLEKENFKEAIPLLERLEKESSIPSDVVFAVSNLMKAYYKEDLYAKSVVYAEKVMQQEESDIAAKNDSQIIVARSAMKTGDETKAKKTYAKLKGVATGELGAEVLYYEAYFLNKEGKYEKSNGVVQQLAQQFSGYKYYGAKGLLIMADNFYQLKDTFQATYVLETVLGNFKNYPDVIEKAQQQLEKIQENEEFKLEENQPTE